MNNAIVYNKETSKYIVSQQMLEIIKNLSKKDMYKAYRKKLTTEFDYYVFQEKINNIMYGVFLNLKVGIENANKSQYDTTKLNLLVEKVEKLFPEEKKYHNRVNFTNLNLDDLSELLIIANDIENEIERYCLIRDLINAKNDCVENMKYFLDNKTIANWINEYDIAVNSKNIDKMKSMLDQIQNMILQEWSNYFQNLESMNDDNFAFLGHSTSSSDFNGEFHANYVSTSLLTQDLTDTYKRGYGFIFAPKNIVGAKSKDMYIKNYADNDESITNSSIKKIDHPKRVIEETKKQKEENIKHGVDEIVYNEIVLKQFEPIGIFCFTDGSKKFNCNQNSAERLKKSFPNLKIYSFDVMKRKKGQDLINMKLELLNSIQLKNTSKFYEIRESMLDKFDYFFEQFEILKQSGQYDESMIANIFNHNKEMLFIFPDELFSGKFNRNEIKYILRKNYKFELDKITSRKANAFIVNNLKQLYPYKEKISGMFEGLEELIELLQKIEITDEMMNEINNLESLNFLTISKYLASKLMISINSREEQSKNNLSKLEKEYASLVSEYQKCFLIEEQYQYYSDIYSNRFFLDTVKKDYQELMEKVNKTNLIGNEFESKLRELENEIVNLSRLNDSYFEKKYTDSSKHIEYENVIDKINSNINNLSKHSFFNRKKIKEEKIKIKYFLDKDLEEKNKFENKKEFEIESNNNNIKNLDVKIRILKIDIKSNQDNINKLNEEIIFIQNKIKTYYKCELIEQAEIKIKESQEFMKNYDSFNSIRLCELKQKIQKLNNVITEQQKNIEVIQEEKNNISRRM